MRTKRTNVHNIIEEQLSLDLRHYLTSFKAQGFDWSGVLEEGNWIEYENEHYESFSGLKVEGVLNNFRVELVGDIDFVLNRKTGAPVFFWDVLEIQGDNGSVIKLKKDYDVPEWILAVGDEVLHGN